MKRVAENTEVPVKASVSDQPRTTIKNGKLFALMDGAGLIPHANNVGLGLYYDDTRFLSSWQMTVNGMSPVLISADTTEGYAARYAYSNKEHKQNGEQITEQRFYIERQVTIHAGLRERLTITNFDITDRAIHLAIDYGSDFADMFEVRGWIREARGHRQDTRIYEDSVRLGYIGLDWMERSTTITFAGHKPTTIDNRRAEFVLNLSAGESTSLEINVQIAPLDMFIDEYGLKVTADSSTPDNYQSARQKADAGYKAWRDSCATITTDNTTFNRLLERSYRDIYMLRQATPRGTCVSAGIPWFAVAFGRDQEVTGLATLPFMPNTTKDILQVLLGYMGTTTNEFTEERPGRILHELRQGEMARLHEHAFLPYYGTVDATPLFLVLMAQYAEWTSDFDFVAKHWDKIERALSYIDEHLKDGYLSYGGKADAALSNQGWKDSHDSVMDRAGKLATAPIALCEVHGYLYHGWNKASQMARQLGKFERADTLAKKARSLRRRFQKDFWMEDRNYPALALHANGKQCDVISSNAGHLLFTGILTRKQALSVAKTLLEPHMFSGFGIRTLSANECNYNPLSYHNGSIWPHDNGVAAWGMAHVGKPDLAAEVLKAMYQVAQTQPDMRLPELFCGFDKGNSLEPVRYPVSCSPQAWSAASVFMMLSGCLGLTCKDGVAARAALPDFIGKVEVRGLTRGNERFDLTAVRSRRGKTRVTIKAS
ncbi:MAG: amylo-alpha-1,6-glucosidase [Candidatus Obscuribacter sp.]|nr:amylo-alpha-1,6-glucosidase [Candidatus Obscuribacter sp.]